MVRINETALLRLARDWKGLPAVTLRGAPSRHPYAWDLDVCGDASLFRLFTTVTLPPGVETLRRWLLEPAPPLVVVRRQEAVEELSTMVEFRQSVEAKGRLTEGPPPDAIQRFVSWSEDEGWLLGHPWILWTARAIPLVTAALFVLFWVGWIGPMGWVAGLAAGFLFATQFRNRIHPLMEAASGGQERFERYAAVLGILLGAKVETPLLRGLQEAILTGPAGAEEELRRLGTWVGWANTRYSGMAHAPLQAVFAWDIHVLWGLEQWKARSGAHVRRWLEALGELEALCALASLRGEHPDWCMPSVMDTPAAEDAPEHPGFVARAMGHPLLPQPGCVRNDLEVGPPGTFLFVTGSNMSGKSTLLRAAGLNAVLAQAGGPVCAEALEMVPLRVHTSMRTADSLAEGVSQYMAELNRIRDVVDAARADDLSPVIFLLDEPLQGTNEAERRVAVQTILGHLLDAGAVGAVATHDLRLDERDRLKAAAQPVHLEGIVSESDAGPRLTFDYRIRTGRATSSNALALLRAVGLGEEPSPSRMGGTSARGGGEGGS